MAPEARIRRRSGGAVGLASITATLLAEPKAGDHRLPGEYAYRRATDQF